MPKPSEHRRRGKHALDDDDVEWLDNTPEDLDGPPSGDRWSTWDQSTPPSAARSRIPDWLVTELAAVDTELGILKTGKEADVYLLARGVPGTDRSCLLAAKRYRVGRAPACSTATPATWRAAGSRDSRINRAMASRTAFGKEVIAGQWAAAEFGALCRLWQLGVPVPYPVQILGTEMLLEFIGTAATASPRPGWPSCGRTRPTSPACGGSSSRRMATLARAGLAHGDLSPYNLLVHEGRLVIIDLPQIVDVVANPPGPEFLARDARNVATWFAARGVASADADSLASLLRAEARLG